MGPPRTGDLEEQGLGAPALGVALGVFGALAWLTSPSLGTFRGAIIPWPAHGMAIALILAAPRRARVAVSCTIGLLLLVALWPASRAIGMAPLRLLAADTLLVGEAVAVVLLYERFAGRTTPLAGTTPYATFLAATLIGTLPTTAIASLTVRLSPEAAAGYSAFPWWSAAVTSGATLAGLVLAVLPNAPHAERGRSPLSVEFAALALLYVVALLAAFLEWGPFARGLTPAIATLPFLAWAGMRFGVRGFAVIAALLTVAVLLSTVQNVGPFGRLQLDDAERLRRAWVYLASLVGPAMIFPVALAEREEATRRTRGALAQLQAVFAGASDLIAALDRDLTLIAANPAWIDEFARIHGVQPRIGFSAAQLYGAETGTGGGEGPGASPGESIRLWRRAVAGERFTIDRTFVRTDGVRVEYEVTYAPVLDEQGEIVGASQVLRDVSARRRREADEAESRRLESIGRLAGGVAHDFNNLMTAVMGYGELLAASFPPDDPRREDIGEIQRAAARAGELTQQLLAFARRKEVRPVRLDVGEQLVGVRRLVSSLVGPSVDFSIVVAPGLPRVLMDPAQFDQVILNLAVNARDAMPEGGSLRVEVDEAPGGGVRIAVSDTGVGMPPEVLARAFEPFFTTKPVGQGTGLGLSTVHGVVHQAGGDIDVVSAPAQGTTFRIVLPAAPARATPASGTAAPEAAPGAATRAPA